MNNLFDIDNWREIGATLSRNKTRTFLTAFGIFWGTFMLALLWGGGHGMRGMLIGNFDSFASNSAFVFLNRTTMPYKGYRKGMSYALNSADMERIRVSVPGIDVISPTVFQAGRLAAGRYSTASTIQGVDPGFARIMNPVITDGRFFNDADVSAERKVCLLGDNLAMQLFPDGNAVGQYVDIDNIYYRVIGTMHSRQRNIQFGSRVEDSAYVPLSTMQRSYNVGDKFAFMILSFKPGVKPAEARPAIERVIRSGHPIHPDDQGAIVFMDISQMFEMVDNVFTGVDFLLLFVGFSSLLAGIIGVGNIMWIVVKERTKEFGIRRAIGAKPRSLLVQIMLESAVLTVIAGVAGICCAVGVLALLSKMPLGPDQAGANFLISFGESMVILALFIVLGAAAGTIPALKAMKIKPVEAMNDK